MARSKANTDETMKLVEEPVFKFNLDKMNKAKDILLFGKLKRLSDTDLSAEARGDITIDLLELLDRVMVGGLGDLDMDDLPKAIEAFNKALEDRTNTKN